MTGAAPLRRFRPGKKWWLLGAIGILLTLGFHLLRARRLWEEAKKIAVHSARFPRDYRVGSGTELTYLVMGDSTGAGWGAENHKATYPHQIAAALAARNYRVRVVNVAVGGATTQQVRREQTRFLQQIRPDLVSLSVGANDATHGTSPSDFKREMGLLSAELAASSARTVLLANVPDMFLAPALPLPFAMMCGRRARQLNQELETLPHAAKIHIVDLHGSGKLDFRREPQLYAPDLFHPSGLGYARWSRLFIKQLKLRPILASISP